MKRSPVMPKKTPVLKPYLKGDLPGFSLNGKPVVDGLALMIGGAKWWYNPIDDKATPSQKHSRGRDAFGPYAESRFTHRWKKGKDSDWRRLPQVEATLCLKTYAGRSLALATVEYPGREPLNPDRSARV